MTPEAPNSFSAILTRVLINADYERRERTLTECVLKDNEGISGTLESGILRFPGSPKDKHRAKPRPGLVSLKMRASLLRLRDEANDVAFARRQLESLPHFKREKSVERCGTFMHEAYFELLPPDFTVADIEWNLEEIFNFLLGRFPDCLDKSGRRNRHRKILGYHTDGDHLTVCQSVYPAIESLIRQEVLFTFPGWKEKFQRKKTSGARRNFCTQELASVIKGEHKEIKLLDDGLSEDLIEIGFRPSMDYLKQAFESFDPIHANDEERKSWRHVFVHGWIDEASFVDALNALLVYDTLLQLVARAKPPE